MICDRKCVGDEIINKLIGSTITNVCADDYSIEIIFDNGLRLYAANDYDEDKFEITEVSKNA